MGGRTDFHRNRISLRARRVAKAMVSFCEEERLSGGSGTPEIAVNRFGGTSTPVIVEKVEKVSCQYLYRCGHCQNIWT